ncbi:MAG: hypothetical protein ACR5LD_07570 [Symbiopectobacterium sp.]
MFHNRPHVDVEKVIARTLAPFKIHALHVRAAERRKPACFHRVD